MFRIGVAIEELQVSGGEKFLEFREEEGRLAIGTTSRKDIVVQREANKLFRTGEAIRVATRFQEKTLPVFNRAKTKNTINLICFRGRRECRSWREREEYLLNRGSGRRNRC